MNYWKFIFYWLPPLLWMGFIFPTNQTLTTGSTSHIIVPILKWLFPHTDEATIHLMHIAVRKCTHFLNYAFLTFLWHRAFRRGKGIRRPEWVIYAGAIAVSYGALDEVLQSFFPSRTGSLLDWLIDAAGVVLVVGIITVKTRKSGLKKMD